MLGRGKGDGARGQVFLAAFGKHPGWDDHIEDLGVETELLATLKQVLYVQGIGGAIDSGAWENLADVQRAEGFAHVFVLRRPGSVVVGRLWSSVDGKGRAKYPMVLCAQCAGAPLPWAVREVLPRLEALQQRCQAVGTAGEVIAALDETRRELQELAATLDTDTPDLVVSPRTLAGLADHPQMGEGEQGAFRVMYLLEREMSAYLRGNYVEAVREGDVRPIQMRVPACGDDLNEVVLQWFDFMYGQVDQASEVWLIVPLELSWVDVFIGEPAPQQFFCLQASRKALPLATEIPYTLDEDFIARSRARVEASRAGTAEEVVVRPEAAPAPRRIRREPSEVREKLASLRQSGGLRAALITIIAAAVVLGALVAAITLWPADGNGTDGDTGRRPPVQQMVPKDQKAWRDVCTTMYEWLGGFLANIDQDHLRRWAEDPHLRQHVVPILSAVLADELKLDPRRYANLVGRTLNSLASDSKAKPEEVLRKTHEAHDAIERLRTHLGLGPGGSHAWPARKRLTALAEQYKRRNWTRQAAWLDGLLKQVRPSPELARSIDRLLDAHADANALEAVWQDIQAKAETLADANSDVLASFGRYAEMQAAAEAREAAPDGLADMAAGLEDVRALADRLVAFVRGPWQNDVDRRLVANSPPVPAPKTPEDLAGGKVFQTWLAAVRGEQYARLDPDADPRRGEDWAKEQRRAIQAVRAKITELRTKYGYEKTGELTRKLDEQAEALENLLALRWDQEHKAEILDRTAAMPKQIDPLDWQAATLIAQQQGGIEAFLDSIPPRISTSSAINAAWQRRVAELKKITDLGKLMTKVKRLETDLGKLDSELPVSLGAQLPDVEWSRALATEALAERRDAVLAEAVKALAWKDGQFERPDAFEARWASLRKDFDAWRKDVAALARDCYTVQAGLAVGMLPDEKVAGGRTLAELCADWKDRPVFAQPGVRQAVEPVQQRVERLLEVWKLSDRQKLLEAAGQPVSGRFERTRAAWKRLAATAPPWPATRQELARERDLHRQLMAVYELVKDDDRRKALQEELTAECRRRWRVYFASRREPRDIEHAIERAGEHYVNPADPAGLEPIGRFRLALYRFRRSVLGDGSPSDEDAAKAVEAFLAKAAGLPGGVAGREPVAGFLKDLRAVVAKKDTGSDLSNAGPARAGWRADVAPDGGSVKYTWASDRGERHALGFARVEPEGQKASFVCTTEVPVGLFADVVSAAGKWDELLAHLPKYPSPEEDFRRGPRTWELAGRGREGITHAVQWVRLPEGVNARKFYVPDVPVSAQPKRDHPMQYLSPTAAALFAKLLGSRLPSSSEWRAAYDAYERGHPNPPNLRDATWKRQWEHVRQMEADAAFHAPLDYYPNAGIFWPKGYDVPTVKEDDDAGAADDKMLWFARVTAGRPQRLHHLVGNVAEYVFEDPKALAGVDGSAEAVAGLLSGSAGSVAVIGASAMSSPKLPRDRPRPVDPAIAAEGFSDVGFRLAFTAPAEALRVRLRRLLTERGYLAAPPE